MKNCLILLIILVISLLFFNYFIKKKLLNFIIYFLDKNLPNKFKYKKNILNLINRILTKSKEISNQFIIILLIINTTILITLLLFSNYILLDLITNMEHYIELYNNLKK